MGQTSLPPSVPAILSAAACTLAPGPVGGDGRTCVMVRGDRVRLPAHVVVERVRSTRAPTARAAGRGGTGLERASVPQYHRLRVDWPPGWDARFSTPTLAGSWPPAPATGSTSWDDAARTGAASRHDRVGRAIDRCGAAPDHRVLTPWFRCTTPARWSFSDGSAGDATTFGRWRFLAPSTRLGRPCTRAGGAKHAGHTDLGVMAASAEKATCGAAAACAAAAEVVEAPDQGSPGLPDRAPARTARPAGPRCRPRRSPVDSGSDGGAAQDEVRRPTAVPTPAHGDLDRQLRSLDPAD